MIASKKDFEAYADWVRERKILRRKLNQMRNLYDTVRGSSKECPYTEHTITIRGRNIEEERRIRERVDDLTEAIKAVDDAIYRAPNSSIRNVLMLRYQEGMRWQDVADALGGSATKDSVRKIVNRFFEKK